MYCNVDDLGQALPLEILIQLTDDANLGVVGTGRIDEAVATAGAEIDGWCAARYLVPFVDPVPALIRKCAIDVAIYNLYGRRLETVPETRVARYKEAMRLLEKIATGGVELASAPVAAQETASGASFTGNDRQLTRQLLKGM